VQQAKSWVHENHQLHFAQQGFEIVGIDISEKMLARAKEKVGNQCPIIWHLGDIRSFDLTRKFKLINFPFNAIAHLHDLRALVLVSSRSEIIWITQADLYWIFSTQTCFG
jgi:SAM-dependent methyltransferase